MKTAAREARAAAARAELETRFALGSDAASGYTHDVFDQPCIVAGKGGGSLHTGRFLPDIKGNQGDLLTTLLGCAGIPLDRPIGIATKQISEMKA